MLGTRSPLAIEAAYIGSAQNIDALGLDKSAVLLGHGLEADLRLDVGHGRVAPFVFGGLGWAHYEVIDGGAAPSLRDGDDVRVAPVGAGVAVRIDGASVVLDARATYRPAFGAELLRDGGDLDTLSVTARAGFAF